MNAKVDLAVLTNALTDIIIHVDNESIEGLGLKHGHLNDRHASKEIINKLDFKTGIEVPAGSPANVGFSAARLGLKTALLGTVGNDKYGQDYLQSLNQAGIVALVRSFSGLN